MHTLAKRVGGRQAGCNNMLKLKDLSLNAFTMAAYIEKHRVGGRCTYVGLRKGHILYDTCTYVQDVVESMLPLSESY